MIKKDKKKFLKIALSTFILLISLSIILLNKNNQNQFPQETVIDADFILIKKQKIAKEIDYAAKISAINISQIRPQISGYIRKIKFTEGSYVKKNQILYEIDSDVAESQYQSAKSNYSAATKKKNRYQKLIDEKLISKQEFEEIENSFYQAKSNFTQAKKNLDFTKVLAPISGFIGKNNFVEGSLVTQNQIEPLAIITKNDQLYLDVQIPADDYYTFNSEKNILVKIFDSQNSLISQGKLKVVEKFVDESTDSIAIRGIVENKEGKLLPGMFVSAKIILAERSVILAPQRSTFRDISANLAVLTIDENNLIKTKIIEADEIYQDNWIVKNGLSEGDRIIYEGFQKLKDEMKVNPIIKEI
jgi:membrane fusion protein (multidrug efflux system)